MGQSPKFGVAQKIMVNTKTSQTSGEGSLELWSVPAKQKP